MKRLFKVVAQGLALVLPLIVTIWILAWLGTTAERVLSDPLRRWVGDYYRPGLGIAVALVGALVVGIAARFWLVATVIRWVEKLVRKVPLVKLLYDSLRDMTGFMDTDKKSFTRVVLVRLPDSNSQTVGFVTRETLEDIPSLRHKADRVAVYVSAAYGFMGLLLLVRREDIEEVNMSVADGMRFVLSGAVSASDEERGGAPPALPPGRE